jgi:uncharacterized membrane protein
MASSPFLLIVLFIIAALAGITGIVALSKSRLVHDHPQSTYEHHRLARRGKREGMCGLIAGVVLVILAAIAMYNFAHPV